MTVIEESKHQKTEISEENSKSEGNNAQETSNKLLDEQTNGKVKVNGGEMFGALKSKKKGRNAAAELQKCLKKTLLEPPSINTESSINLNVDAGDDEEDEVQEVAPRPMGRDSEKFEEGVGSSGTSSTMNEEALARLMVSELAMHNEHAMEMKKQERVEFLEIKKREMKIREQELAMQEYKKRQKDMMLLFYMQPYNHLTGDALKQMEEIRAEIKAKWNLPY